MRTAVGTCHTFKLTGSWLGHDDPSCPCQHITVGLTLFPVERSTTSFFNMCFCKQNETL
jgi:hypothetical protein